MEKSPNGKEYQIAVFRHDYHKLPAIFNETREEEKEYWVAEIPTTLALISPRSAEHTFGSSPEICGDFDFFSIDYNIFMNNFAERIEKIRQADPELKVFGANHHRYEGQKLNKDELEGFETWCGCELPGEYRDYLLNIGTGVGPGCYLLSVAQIKTEMTSLYDSYEMDIYSSGTAAGPFDLAEKIDQAIADGTIKYADFSFSFPAPEKCSGFIPIQEQGCFYLGVLITSGKYRGCVFDISDQDGRSTAWRPAKRSTGLIPHDKNHDFLPPFQKIPTFNEWINGWLDQCWHDFELS